MFNKPYLSLQELTEKTEKTKRQITEQLDKTATYHPDDGNLTYGLKSADAYEVQQALMHIPLREFLANTTASTGTYLVAAAVHTKLEQYVQAADIVPLISAEVVNGWAGSDLTVDILSRAGYKAHKFSSGASMHTETVETKAATLSPISFGIAPRITEDFIEDNAFDIIDMHLKKAAAGIGELASEMALTVLGTATDGWGTLNSSASGDADETKWTGGATADIEDAKAALTDDHWIANTLLLTTEAWEHSLQTTHVTLASNIPQVANIPAPAAGFDMKLDIPPIDVLFYNGDYMHAAYPTDTTAMTNCITFLFDRNNALLTGRKRWMQLNNYSDPIKDLAGMTITCRQDSVTMYNDAIYKLTET